MNPTRANFYNFSDNRCPMEEDKFLFADIRKGDKVRFTKVSTTGEEVQITGVAHKLQSPGSTSESWATESGVGLGSRWYTTQWTTSYELLERIEPKDHLVVKVLTDGTIRVPMTEPVTLAEATEKKAHWDDDLYSPREASNKNMIVKLVEV